MLMGDLEGMTEVSVNMFHSIIETRVPLFVTVCVCVGRKKD
jgi:hypothetical protein